MFISNFEPNFLNSTGMMPSQMLNSTFGNLMQNAALLQLLGGLPQTTQPNMSGLFGIAPQMQSAFPQIPSMLSNSLSSLMPQTNSLFAQNPLTNSSSLFSSLMNPSPLSAIFNRAPTTNALSSIFGSSGNVLSNLADPKTAAGTSPPPAMPDPFNAGYIFGRMDSNGDRSVSEQEYKNWVGMGGTLPEPSPAPQMPAPQMPAPAPTPQLPQMPAPAPTPQLPQMPAPQPQPLPTPSPIFPTQQQQQQQQQGGLPQQQQTTGGAPQQVPAMPSNPTGTMGQAPAQTPPDTSGQQPSMPQQGANPAGQAPGNNPSAPQPGASNPADPNAPLQGTGAQPNSTQQQDQTGNKNTDLTPEQKAVVDALKKKAEEEQKKADAEKAKTDGAAQADPNTKDTDKDPTNKDDTGKDTSNKDAKKPSELQLLWRKADAADGKTDKKINLKALAIKADTTGGAKEGEGDGRFDEKEYKVYADMLGLKIPYEMLAEKDGKGIDTAKLVGLIKSADKDGDKMITEAEFMAFQDELMKKEPAKEEDVVIDAADDAKSKDDKKADDKPADDKQVDDTPASPAPDYLSINTNAKNGIRPDELEAFFNKNAHIKDGKFTKDALIAMFADFGWDKSKLGQPVLNDLTADGKEKTPKEISNKMFEKLDRDKDKTAQGVSGLVPAELGDMVQHAKKKK